MPKSTIRGYNESKACTNTSHEHVDSKGTSGVCDETNAQITKDNFSTQR